MIVEMIILTNRPIIVHGLYDVIYPKIHWRNVDYYLMPTKFFELLRNKAKKWNQKKYQAYPLIPFTLGIDGDIITIAIVHPWDIFKEETGEDIVRGRIKRQLGLFNRPTYDRIQAKNREDELLFTCDKDGNELPLYKEVPPYIIIGD